MPACPARRAPASRPEPHQPQVSPAVHGTAPAHGSLPGSPEHSSESGTAPQNNKTPRHHTAASYRERNAVTQPLLLLGFLLFGPRRAPLGPALPLGLDDAPLALRADGPALPPCHSRRSCRSRGNRLRHRTRGTWRTTAAHPGGRCSSRGGCRSRRTTQDRVQLFLKCFDLFFNRNRTTQLLTGQTGECRIHEASEDLSVSFWQAGNDAFSSTARKVRSHRETLPIAGMPGGSKKTPITPESKGTG